MNWLYYGMAIAHVSSFSFGVQGFVCLWNLVLSNRMSTQQMRNYCALHFVIHG